MNTDIIKSGYKVDGDGYNVEVFDATGDIREGMPSASSFHRLALCPGSYRQSIGAPPSPDNTDSASGTRIHAVLAGEEPDQPLSDEERQMEEWCREQTQEIINEWMVRERIVCIGIEKHRRMWCRKQFALGYSGEADVLANGKPRRVETDAVLVIDYKTGRVPVEPAEANHQLLALAVLASYDVPEASSVTCAIVQPWCGQPTVTRYDSDDLRHADNEVGRILADAADPDAPLRPSQDACKWCPAKPSCPALTQLVAHSSSNVPAVNWGSLTDPQKVEAFRVAKLAEKWAEAVKRACRTDMERGHHIGGLELREGREIRTVTDVAGAYSLLSNAMTPEQFTGACKVSIPALADQYASLTGTTKKSARREVDVLLEPVIETEFAAPSVVESK